MTNPKARPDTAGTDQGVVFPVVGGSRSSTATGRAVLADAARALDPELADAIEREPDWRRRYVSAIRRLVEAELRSAAGCAALAEAGLTSLHDRFEFVRDGDTLPLPAALEQPTGPQLHTATVRGTAAGGIGQLAVPHRGDLLAGDELRRQLDRWVEAGTVEPSFAEALGLVLDNPDWLDLSDQTVAVLGAGAEMGPLEALCRWNATVLAIDLPRPGLWERILSTAVRGAGTVHVPTTRAHVREDELAQAAGVDLITHTPEVGAWLATFDGPLTLGNYVYADGAGNVRVAMAVDALTVQLTEQRADVALSVLVTPTDVFAVPADAVAMAHRRYADRRMSERVAGALTGHRLFARSYDGTITTGEGLRFGVVDSLVPQQGPNYALAKRLQRWRATLARDRGIVTSANVAPATRTRSVTKNKVLAAAYDGAPRFGVEIFEPATSNMLMAALLVHDLRNDKAASQPDAPLDHPAELFIQGANHGGLWRIGFAPRSALSVAALIGLAKPKRSTAA